MKYWNEETGLDEESPTVETDLISQLNGELEELRILLLEAEGKDRIKEIRQSIRDVTAEISVEKKHIAEERRFEREEARAVTHEYWEAIGYYWHEFIKRPTKTQVKTCIEELDSENPSGWDDGIATALFEKLVEKFPELRRVGIKNPKVTAPLVWDLQINAESEGGSSVRNQGKSKSRAKRDESSDLVNALSWIILIIFIIGVLKFLSSIS